MNWHARNWVGGRVTIFGRRFAVYARRKTSGVRSPERLDRRAIIRRNSRTVPIQLSMTRKFRPKECCGGLPDKSAGDRKNSRGQNDQPREFEAFTQTTAAGYSEAGFRVVPDGKHQNGADRFEDR